MRKQIASTFALGSCLVSSPAEFACRAIRGTLPWWAQPHHELENERAINDAKSTEWDKQFRRQWYRAAWQREKRRAREQRVGASLSDRQFQVQR